MTGMILAVEVDVQWLGCDLGRAFQSRLHASV